MDVGRLLESALVEAQGFQFVFPYSNVIFEYSRHKRETISASNSPSKGRDNLNLTMH